MSGQVPETYGSVGPWQRYVTRERAARGSYLAVVERAQHEYLGGPWPDREAYQHVELSAWVTYYAAGREAWRHYVAEITPPPPPPGHVAPGALAMEKANQWADQTGGSRPYPTFSERDGGNQ